jgi:hypothetical protein
MVKYVFQINTQQHNLQKINHQNSQQEQDDKGVHPPPGYISLSLHQWTWLSGINFSKVILQASSQFQWKNRLYH